MLRYSLKRLLSLAISLIIASLVIFLVIEVAPGDPASFMLGINAQEDTLNALREELGLNQSKLERYLSWTFGMLQGDFGTFTGSMQEYHEWLEFVDEEAFDDHTLNPTSYVSALNATSSYDTLIRHYTLGSDTIGIPLNVNQTIISSSHPNQSIKNFRKPIGSDKTNAEAYGFNEPSDNQRGNFIPVEETYFVRGASLGASNPRSQKIRLEDQKH